MKQSRKAPDERKAEMLDAALELAQEGHYATVTRDRVAEAVGVTGSVVQYHFGTMALFRAALMRHAVEKRCARVVLQGLCLRDPAASEADNALLNAAVRCVGVSK